jgi:hypothetical protein
METHPLRTARRTVNRAASFWGFDYIASREIEHWRGWSLVAAMPLLVLEAGSYLVVAALAIVGIGAFGGRYGARWLAWLSLMVIAYAAPYAVSFSGGAYHFPVVPIVIPFAAIPIAAGLRTTWRQLAPNFAVLAALGLFALVQVQYGYYAFVMRG